MTKRATKKKRRPLTCTTSSYWDVPMRDLTTGKFVVVESVFNPDEKEDNQDPRPGIAVTKVQPLSFVLFVPTSLS